MISFTLEELDGVPADVVKGYKKRSEGDIEVYDVTFRIPDIFPIVSSSLFSFMPYFSNKPIDAAQECNSASNSAARRDRL